VFPTGFVGFCGGGVWGLGVASLGLGVCGGGLIAKNPLWITAPSSTVRLGALQSPFQVALGPIVTGPCVATFPSSVPCTSIPSPVWMTGAMSSALGSTRILPQVWIFRTECGPLMTMSSTLRGLKHLGHEVDIVRAETSNRCPHM
jgi:hypothetical protein